MGSAATALAVLATLVVVQAETGPQTPGQMSPARIREAIRWGLSAPEGELRRYELATEKTWLVNFDTPFLRVARLARSRMAQKPPLTEADVSPKVSAELVHVYAHARADGSSARLPNVEYVAILRPRPDQPPETILPLTLQTFVRRVPAGEDFDGPTRLARSAKATFPLQAFVAGAVVRLTFQGGSVRTVSITPQTLAPVR